MRSWTGKASWQRVFMVEKIVGECNRLFDVSFDHSQLADEVQVHDSFELLFNELTELVN